MSQKNSCLTHFVECLSQVADPRSKQGVSHPFATILAVTFLGLIANVRTPAEIARWAKYHFKTLKKFLKFGEIKGKIVAPCDNTYTRVWRKLSYEDLQNAYATFLNVILGDTAIIGAVDGKTAKQTKDKDGNPIHMLNVFAHKLKLHLASWDCKGDKTNESGCLKRHAGELFTMYPCLKLLTGDAAYSNRPLVEAIRMYDRDYLFQVKDNMPKVLAKLEKAFKDAPTQEPDDCREIAIGDAPSQRSPKRKTKSYDRKVNKKRGLLRYAAYG
jgi:hypothetical protein